MRSSCDSRIQEIQFLVRKIQKNSLFEEKTTISNFNMILGGKSFVDRTKESCWKCNRKEGRMKKGMLRYMWARK